MERQENRSAQSGVKQLLQRRQERNKRQVDFGEERHGRVQGGCQDNLQKC